MNESVMAAAEGPAVHAPEPPAGTVARSKDWLVGQLPAGMLSEDFFVRFVRIFQEQAQTLLTHADSLPHLADPQLAPPEMVRYLARWLGAPGIDDSYDEATQRAVLATIARTLPWRGTRHALVELAQLYSGGPATIADGGGVFAQGRAPADAAWVRIEVAGTGSLLTEDFLALMLDELPAHVRAQIVVGGRQVWPPSPDSVTDGEAS